MDKHQLIERIGFFRGCAGDCSALAEKAIPGPAGDRLLEFASLWATMATKLEAAAVAEGGTLIEELPAPSRVVRNQESAHFGIRPSRIFAALSVILARKASTVIWRSRATCMKSVSPWDGSCAGIAMLLRERRTHATKASASVVFIAASAAE